MPGTTSQDNLHSMSADVGTLAMAGGTVVALNEASKAFSSDEHALKHAFRAGLGAAAVVGGYEITRRANEDGDDRDSEDKDEIIVKKVCTKHSRTHRSPSVCSDEEHERHRHNHKAHLMEELAGAWAAIKVAMGDKEHKKVHLVEELLGAFGLYQEAKEHRKHHD